MKIIFFSLGISCVGTWIERSTMLAIYGLELKMSINIHIYVDVWVSRAAMHWRVERHWLLVSIYLIQLSGSPSQSVLHRKRSHDSHPIGGVRAKPFSKQFVFGTRITAHMKIVPIAVAMAVAELLRCEQIIFDTCVSVWAQLRRLQKGRKKKKYEWI